MIAPYHSLKSQFTSAICSACLPCPPSSTPLRPLFPSSSIPFDVFLPPTEPFYLPSSRSSSQIPLFPLSSLPTTELSSLSHQTTSSYISLSFHTPLTRFT